MEQKYLPGRELRRWKEIAGAVSASLLGLLFLISGMWKLLDAPGAAERMLQSLVPLVLSMPAALTVGIGEVFAAILLFWPRFRRWGALLAALMLIAFMIYVGALYGRLTGEECNCFPWIQRVVGPMFFVGDALMLALAVLAGLWSRKAEGLRAVAAVLAGVTVFALGSYGVAALTQSGIRAPETITVEGQTYSLNSGRVLLYFFDPECSHCDAVAREMAKQNWGDAEIVAVPTAQPQFAEDFVTSTGLDAKISRDTELLRRTFQFVDSPYAAALVDGRQRAAFNAGQLDRPDFHARLRSLGFLK